jgi:non-lysosomal glucosylceramidase
MKPTGRRGFLKTVAAAGTLPQVRLTGAQGAGRAPIEYPRKYSGRQLAMLAFPLGGVGAGSISLGGRGQLRDWEIFNKPDKGRSPAYAFASIWCGKVTRVLEARLLPPYEGPSGLGSANVPGLPRL